MVNKTTLHTFNTTAFKELFPKYVQLRRLFKISDSTLQRAILYLGDSGFYSSFKQSKIAGDFRYDEVFSSDSTGFKSLIRFLLLRRFPDLCKFDIQVYNLEEFYIGFKDSEFCLYVPLKSFLQRDFNSIKIRTVSYYTQYFSHQKNPKIRAKELEKFIASDNVQKVKDILKK